MAGDRIIEGKLEEKVKKPNPRGGNYIRVKIGNRYYSIFDPGEHTAVDKALGHWVRIKVRGEYSEKDGKTYENYVAGSFEDLGDVPPQKEGDHNGGTEMSKEEWEFKNLLDRRTKIAEKCIETWAGGKLDPGAAQIWVDWIYGVTQAPPVAPPFYGPEPVTNIPGSKLGDEIDISSVSGPPDFSARLKTYFPGLSLTTAAKEGGLSDAIALGKQTPEKLTTIWQGIVAVRKSKSD